MVLKVILTLTVLFVYVHGKANPQSDEGKASLQAACLNGVPQHLPSDAKAEESTYYIDSEMHPRGFVKSKCSFLALIL